MRLGIPSLEQDAGAEKPACASGAQFHREVSLVISFVCTPCTVSSLFTDSPMLGRSELSSLDVVVQADRPRQLPTINKQHSALLMLASVGETIDGLSMLKVPPSTIWTHLGLSLVFQNREALPVPVTAVSYPIIGNRRSHICHRPDCPNYSQIAPPNRVAFKSIAAAELVGYRIAENCP
jgi:hypothetical protein